MTEHVQGTDLSRRHRQPEIMDAPDLPAARLVETLKGLGRVNAVTQSSRLMWPDLEAAARRNQGETLRVLDVACGGGDVLITLWRWANKAGIDVELAGCDASQEAVAYAREAASSADARVTFFEHRVTRDALPGGFHVIMSTLFLHHLDEGDAVDFLRQAASNARDRLVIQDILRSRLSYWFARAGTRLLLLNDVCRLDGRTSVEGAFTKDEARELANKAGLADAEIASRLPFRYLIRWIRPNTA
jgi:2-polyprenyl-3-methyl-5-hydroxy-6-metoxy-1,4-benzoquinol methylase